VRVEGFVSWFSLNFEQLLHFGHSFDWLQRMHHGEGLFFFGFETSFVIVCSGEPKQFLQSCQFDHVARVHLRICQALHSSRIQLPFVEEDLRIQQHVRNGKDIWFVVFDGRMSSYEVCAESFGFVF
jgi:hypothetical protein